MLPTHGCVMSIFLLANAARHTRYPDIAAWIRATRERSSFMAGATNHWPAASFLCTVGLASSTDGIAPSATLRAVSEAADRTTLVAIASLVVELEPPAWLPFVVIDSQVHFELIPSADLEALEWLRPELEYILLTCAPSGSPSRDTTALGIGRAAELAALAALTASGTVATLVSAVSDRFGYDIESTSGDILRRWEVKGCTGRTSSTFHLSRNEFDKCCSYGSEWAVLQIEFRSEALVAEEILAEHVAAVRELSAADLVACVPSDSAWFRWEESSRVSPPVDAWRRSELAIPDAMRLPSFESLGLDVLNERLRRAPMSSV